MTIKDLIKVSDNAIDIDVCDTELDIRVAFSFDEDMEKEEEPYDKFINMLANRVQIERINWGQYPCLVCRFSEFAEPFNDKIRQAMIDNDGYFEFEDEDEAYLNFISDLEGLIAGYGDSETYCMWLDVFNPGDTKQVKMNDIFDEEGNLREA